MQTNLTDRFYDGTFWICPSNILEIYQLFIIRVYSDVYNEFFTKCYALTRNKSQQL